MELLSHHTGICARIWNITDEVLYAPYLHCTSQPASSILMLPDLQAPHHYADRYILRNTRKIQPTAAWYLSLSLQDHHSKDRLYLPSLSSQQVETLHYPSAYNFLPLEASMAVHSHRSAHNHIYHSERSESAHPSNADVRIPSLLIYSWSLLYQCLFPLKMQSFLPLHLLLPVRLRTQN